MSNFTVSFVLLEKTFSLISFYSDYDYHREHFKRTFTIRFTRIHDECLHDQNIARLIFHIWELCQTYSCCMPYNGKFSSDMKYGRNHFILADFRLTGT